MTEPRDPIKFFIGFAKIFDETYYGTHWLYPLMAGQTKMNHGGELTDLSDFLLGKLSQNDSL